MNALKAYTIGHSTHSLEELTALLHTYHIKHLVDVRSIPKSRRVPWFNKENLNKILPSQNISYTHMPSLGGLRHAHKNSINQGWENASFRGYADYMQTDEFYLAIDELIAIIKKERGHLCIMCAEALPWRCHRSLIADALITRNIPVWHIMNAKTSKKQVLTSFAVVNITDSKIQIRYP
jgi:uncharacterized protein (DUF488 family)